MSQNLETLKNEQITLKEVLSLLNQKITGKDDIKILLNHYIYSNDTKIIEMEKAKLTPDEENLLKYRELQKEYQKADNIQTKYFREHSGNRGIDNFNQEQTLKYAELEKITNDIYNKQKHLRENELNKQKEVKIGDKKYKVVRVPTGSWSSSRAIITGETAKMYKLQFIEEKYLKMDSQQTSYYKYDYPKTLNTKFASKAKDGVSVVKIYEDDTFERLCD